LSKASIGAERAVRQAHRERLCRKNNVLSKNYYLGSSRLAKEKRQGSPPAVWQSRLVSGLLE
jgi:hypothetical protein